MKQVCIYCNRTSPDSNLWCQETHCKAELSPEILSYGEQLGDLEIVKPLVILRSSTIYKARQGEDLVFLKVAHNGYDERLKREARFLMELRQGAAPAGKSQRRQNGNVQKLIQHYPMLPVLLPPYKGEPIQEYYYGKTVFHGESKYYTLFQYIDSTPLRSILYDNPQPWYKHVGQLMLAVTDAVALMHHQNVYHLCLCPDLIMVRFDRENVPRPLLIDLGVACSEQDVGLEWESWLVPLAYRPPEVVQSGRIISAPATDVYGLGAILYELLAGRPLYEYRQRTDADIRNSILREQPAIINRSELAGIPEIAEQAVSKNYRLRQNDVLTLLAQLQNLFPVLPKEKQPRRINWQLVAIVAGVFLAIALLLVLALSIQSAILA